jgi:hypothetical protein
MKKDKTKKRKILTTILSIAIILAMLVSSMYIIYSKLHMSSLQKEVNPNEVPYISTYYIKPVVEPGEKVTLDFYISDYYHKSYTEEDYSNTFTVTIKIDGKKDIIKKKLKAGDNSIKLGKFNELGEQKFSILCTDQYRRNSHELFNFFLVKEEALINEYTMTEKDLTTYNINNDDNKQNGLNTREGLQKLLDDKKLEGYNKLKLLPGTYRIDHTGAIFIPTEFTLDLNQATIKLNGFAGDKALMIDLNNTFDSHVINGTIEGDFYEHNYNNSPNNSEWINGISIGGESKYSSFENLVVKDITGYGGSNGIAKSRDNKLDYTYAGLTPIGDTFKLGDIDRNTGEPIESTNRTTSDFIDINQYSNLGYLTISRHLGYQGNPCGTWNLICHYYAQNKKFIKSTDAYQYRKVGVPSNAKYMKVTILNKDYPTDLCVQLFRVPTHCQFKDIKFENCRAIGLAQFAMKDMLVENCEFTKSGQTLGMCAYDAEDGWDMMQDVTFRKLNFHDNPNNDFLTAAGHNFVIEDMIDGKVHFWPRTNSYVVKNSKNIKSSYLGNDSRVKTGYVRFYDNEIKSGINIASESNTKWPLVIKDSNINGRAESKLGMGNFLRCNIGASLTENNPYETALGPGEYIDCYINNKNGENTGGIYKNCKIENITGNTHGDFDISNSEISSWNSYAGNTQTSYSFKNSTLTNVQIQFCYWHQGATTLIDNCEINNYYSLLKLPHYAMKKSITLSNNKFTSRGNDGIVNFYDDRTGGDAGKLIKQNTLKLENNTLGIPNSKYVITGISNETINNINIIDKNNTYTSKSLLICNPNAYRSKNIFIYN